jgi:formylmethanofuran dehydrogenase subunit B
MIVPHHSPADANSCPVCGCHCGVLSVADGCGLGRTSGPPADAPSAAIAGKPATLDQAIERAAEILSTARFPLVCGLSNSTCETQRAAVTLADRLGACLDVAPSPAAALFADLGTVTCSLGEVKNRADLVVFWGGRPHETHLRLAESTLDPPGRFMPAGRRGRTVIVVGDRATADVLGAELHLPMTPAHDFAALWLLRALVQGKPVDPALGPVAGAPLADWRALADRFKTCRFGVLFLDRTPPAARRAGDAAHGLATDLNTFTRFYTVTLRRPGNAVGAEQVMTWQTGYPSAVGLHGGHPRSFGREYSAARVLARGEADAALLVGTTTLDDLPPPARDYLRRIPVVALFPDIASLPTPAAVAITTAACANPVGGTAFRFDGLALPIRPAISSSFPDEFQVLQRIGQALRRTAAPP